MTLADQILLFVVGPVLLGGWLFCEVLHFRLRRKADRMRRARDAGGRE